MVKSFTNQDDVRSKVLYESLNRCNDPSYFRKAAGINDKMNNVDAILQFAKDPYSYMMHKNRRMLLKMLSV